MCASSTWPSGGREARLAFRMIDTSERQVRVTSRDQLILIGRLEPRNISLKPRANLAVIDAFHSLLPSTRNESTC